MNVTAAAMQRFHQDLETRRLRGFGATFGREQLEPLPDVGAALHMVPRVDVGFNRGPSRSGRAPRRASPTSASTGPASSRGRAAAARSP